MPLPDAPNTSTIRTASKPAPSHGRHLVEGTFTYEYKWVEGMLMRVEYRCDVSNVKYFNKLANQSTDQQQTVTVAFIAFFGPKR